MDIVKLIGHFHPLLVHLPIGILVLGIIMAFSAQFERWQSLRPFIPFILFCSALSSIASCITGYLLSLGGDYDADLLAKHQWTGIALAVISTAFWAFQKYSKTSNKALNTVSWFSLAGLLVVVGHYGGSLTHGLGFITEGVFDAKKKVEKVVEIAQKPLDSVQKTANPSISVSVSPKKDSIKSVVSKDKNAPQPLKNAPILPSTNTVETKTETPQVVAETPVFIYKDLIAPIFEKRCNSCHGPTKSKVDLRLDTPDFILKGSENGSVLEAGNPEKSSLYSTLLLPLEDDAHMPPEGKPQLTEEQIKLIHLWILKGASFDK